MKYAFTTSNPYTPTGYGGGNSIISGLALSLSRNNEVFIIAPGFSDEELKRFMRYDIVCLEDKMSIISIAKIIRKYKFDVIISLTYESLKVGVLSRIFSFKSCVYIADPVIKNFSLFKLSGFKNARYFLGQFQTFLAAKYFVNYIFVISDYTEKEIRENWEISGKELNVIGCGLSQALLDAPFVSPKMEDGLLTIGRIEFNQKPVNILLNWIQKKEDVKLTIVGNGSDVVKLRKMIESANRSNKLSLLTEIIGDDVLELYNNCYCVILLSNVESFWITAYEAVARGRLLIVSDAADVKKNLGGLSTVYILANHSMEELNRAFDWVGKISGLMDLNSNLNFNAERMKNYFHYGLVGNRLEKVIKAQRG
jgi:hypothetical protein